MKKIIFIFTLTLLISGCFLFDKEEEGPSDIIVNSGKTIEFSNITEASIYIEETDTDETSPSGIIKRGMVKRKKEKADIGYTINHLVRLDPVEVDGEKVQANDIIIKSNKAYVAYNTADEVFRGAIQVLDISNTDKIIIEQEIIFKNMDINRLYTDGNILLFGGAADPDIYNSRSFFGKINNLNNLDAGDVKNSLTFFEKSYGVTGITKKGSKYYFGVGAKDGGIYVVDGNLNIENFISRSDIRDLDTDGSYIVGLAGITDADTEIESEVVYLKQNSDELDDERAISVAFDQGEESAYHKATIEVEGNTAYLGLVHQGMGILDIKNNKIESLISNPIVTIESGIKPYTNSVSVDGNLIFSANGEYGFRVYDKNTREILGYRPFEIGIDGNSDEDGQKYSANHIEYKSKYIFVASGEGGVNVYSVK
ncbi:MAG: hypothetical protein ACQERZ_09765 [Fusobacteriota bacterium]